MEHTEKNSIATAYIGLSNVHVQYSASVFSVNAAMPTCAKGDGIVAALPLSLD
jgi:hypothetical protein